MKTKHIALFFASLTLATSAFAQNWNGNSVTASGNVNATGWIKSSTYIWASGPVNTTFVKSDGYLKAGSYVDANSYINAGTSIAAGTTSSAAVGLISSGYLQANGVSYLGSYLGGWALTVSNNGSIVMKKPQGDVAMGQFGN